MRSKLFSLILACLFLLSFPLGVTAEEMQEKTLYHSILSSQTERHGAESVQEWIDGTLAENAGITSEWYVLALCQSGDTYDFSAYAQALLDYLSTHEIYSATTRQKYALCLIGVGSTDPYIRRVLDDSIGAGGITSEIFGLHLLQNGYESPSHSIAELIASLLARQNADGGWSLSGTASDVDVSAMAVQALAAQYRNDEAVTAAIDRALDFLSQKQLASGGYMSYGVENPESVAQVILALSALGIDCETDARFVKNGNTLFGNLGRFALPDGSFCHQLGGAFNENATGQVLCATVAYARMKDGRDVFYLLDARNPAQLQPLPEESQPPLSEADDIPSEPDREGVSYKIWACGGIVLSAGVTILILILLKKRQTQNLIAVALAAALLCGFVCLTDFESRDDFYGDLPQKENVIGTVTVTVRCDEALGKTSLELPTDGYLVRSRTMEIAEGDTVYTILMELARAERLHVDCSGTDASAYVAGIAHLYEFACGDLSGWQYRVNGDVPSVGCGQYRLQAGDVIEWNYSLTMGRDTQ